MNVNIFKNIFLFIDININLNLLDNRIIQSQILMNRR